MREPLNRLKKLMVAGALLLGGIVAIPTAATADVVTDWNATAVTVLNNAAQGRNGPYLSMVHAAIYDAVNGIDKRYTAFGASPTSDTRGASKEAAASAAAYYLLLTLFPSQQSVLDPAYAASLATIPNGPAKTKGIAVGQEIAVAWIALRVGDGRDANVPYTFGTGPGVYQRTPGPGMAPTSPVNTWLPQMKPFALERASQFRAYGPPDLTSERYARDLNMVKSLGSATSTERTPEETEIALFHTESPNTFFWHNLRDFAATKHLDTAASARLFAMVVIAWGDASQACFDSKYYYNFWRPSTAITAADTDNNPETTVDPAWMPLVPTPPHPEYPAAHGCAAGATAETLRRFFGTKHLMMTFTSTVAGTIPHTYHTTDDLVDEIIAARVYGGMHYQTSVIHGAELGRKVAKYMADNYFRPLRR